MPKVSVLLGTLERILCRESYDSPTIEHFLNFFNEPFNQRVSHCVLVSVKGAVTHVITSLNTRQ